MRSSSGTNTPSAETSIVVESTNVQHWQGMIATFLKDAFAALKCPHFYLIQASGCSDSGGSGRVDGGSGNDDCNDVGHCGDVNCGGGGDSNSDSGGGNLYSNGGSAINCDSQW
jgi:hypothetical protein